MNRPAARGLLHELPTAVPPAPPSRVPASRSGRVAARLGVDGLSSTKGSLYPLLVLLGFNAVDELDITAFALLTPEIQETFGISDGALGLVVVLIVLVNVFLGICIGYLADRVNRVRMVRAGAAVWATFAFLTGLAPAIAFLVVARIGAGLGKAVNAPAHRSLLADYYHPRDRAAVYSGYELANPVGRLLAPVVVGVIGLIGFGWRPSFVVLVVPTIVVLIASRRLVNPVRGHHERTEAGASESEADTEETPPTYAEAMALFRAIPTIRRAWLAMPFLVGGIGSAVFLAPQFYEDVFAIPISGRAGISFAGEFAALVGLVVGFPIATKGLRASPKNLFRIIFVVGFVASGGFLMIAVAPIIGVAVLGSVIVSFSTAIVLPAISTLQSLILPSRARSMGFSIGALYALPGLFFIPIALGIGQVHGLRWSIGTMIPVFLAGALILASGARTIEADIAGHR